MLLNESECNGHKIFALVLVLFLRIADQWVVGTVGEHWQKQIELRAQVDTENELPPIFTIFVNLIAWAWFKCKHNAKSFEQDEFKGIQHNKQCYVF